MIEDILQMTRDIKNQMETNLPSINNEIDRIIKNKDTSTKRIEQLLDILLDYLHLGVGEPEFKRLNSYYTLFNEANANVYQGFYQELMEE